MQLCLSYKLKSTGLDLVCVRLVDVKYRKGHMSPALHPCSTPPYRNQVNIELRNAKKNYYSSKIADQKQNPKKAWKSINNLLGKQNKHSKVNKLKLQRALIAISQILDLI